MKRLISILVVLFIAAAAPAIADDHFFSYDLIFPDVYLQDGVAADINVLVLKNTNQRCDKGHKGHKGKSIIALHGLANTASAWKPLASELFSDNPIGKEVCSILAINLPGRGYSGLPEGETGLLFGQLTLDDHAQAVIGTLERVRQAGFHPATIMAHSQGGLIVQMVQQALLDDGSSLRSEFGIKKAFLIAPIGPAAVPWGYATSGKGATDVGGFLNFSNPEVGPHVAIPDGIWPYLFFAYPEVGWADNRPLFEEVASEGYNSPESLNASLQLVRSEALAELIGLAPLDPPQTVDRGIFDKTGTRLEFVEMSRDSFQTAGEPAMLYEYLTNDSSLKKFAVVDSGDAVHSMYLSNPSELLEALIPSKISLP